MKRKQFTFYRSFYEAAMEMTPQNRGAFLLALTEYALNGKMPEALDGNVMAAFRMAIPVLNTARKRAVSGSKPKKKYETNAKQTANKRGTNCKQTQNKKEKENETEIENELENELEVEYETEGENEGRCEGSGRAFDAFWRAYPCQIAQEDAFLAWNRLKPDGETIRAIMEGLDKWKCSEQWLEKGGRFIPRASRWLEEAHYRHPPADYAIPKGASGTLGQAEIEAVQRVLEDRR